MISKPCLIDFLTISTVFDINFLRTILVGRDFKPLSKNVDIVKDSNSLIVFAADANGKSDNRICEPMA